MKKIAAFLAVSIIYFSHVLAFSVPDQPTGYVNDYANILSDNTKQDLENNLKIFTASTSNEIAVVTVPDLGGDVIENYAVKLFERWKIGNAKNDNGVLLLISRDDRKLRIEVGYGLEGALPDIIAKDIIDTRITPFFKENNYDAGVIEGVKAIEEATQNEYVVTETLKNKNSYEDIIIIGFFVFVFLIQFLAAILARSKSWWAGGIIGGILSFIVLFFNIVTVTVFASVIIVVLCTILGLIFDYIVSNTYDTSIANGSSIPWWAGGGGGSSSSDSFGGFGGGSSGGGGASGSW